jgi:hypothetical protein
VRLQPIISTARWALGRAGLRDVGCSGRAGHGEVRRQQGTQFYIKVSQDSLMEEPNLLQGV